MQTPWKAEHIKDYIDFMHRLVEAGLVDTSDQASQKAAENKIAGIFSWYTDTWTEASVTVAAGDDHACYVPVYCSAVDGVEPSLLRQAGLQLGSMALAVTSNCTDLDAVGALMDFVTSEEYYILTEYGVKDYTYTEDADGVRTKIKTGDTFEQQLMASRSAPWTIILPRREMVDRKAEANSVLNAAGDDAAYLEDLQVKAQIAEGSLIAPDYFPRKTAPNLAVETVEEMEQSNAIATDLKTYSSELLMKLILGDRSMDDWDSYLSDLERLGLDDYVAIREARYKHTSNSRLVNPLNGNSPNGLFPVGVQRRHRKKRGYNGMNLIPDKSPATGSYWCTWDTQWNVLKERLPAGSPIPTRDAIERGIPLRLRGRAEQF